MQIIHLPSGVCLCSRLAIAENFWTRLRGLMGKPSFPEGEGLWINPCQGIHSFGMRFPIDVLYLDDDLRIIDQIQSMKPFRIGPVIWNADSVLELPAGTLAKIPIKLTDKLEVR